MAHLIAILLKPATWMHAACVAALVAIGVQAVHYGQSRPILTDIGLVVLGLAVIAVQIAYAYFFTE